MSEELTRTKRINQKLAAVFAPEQAEVLSDVVTEAFQDLVKTSDFSELKASRIVSLKIEDVERVTSMRVQSIFPSLICS